MIKILPPRKGSGKSSTKSQKASSSKTPDHDSQFIVSGNKNTKASSAAPSNEPAAAAPDSFSVKAPQKNAPRPPPTESKKVQQPSTTVPPPKQKVSAKVKVAVAIQEDVDSGSSDAQKSNVPPPKKKSQGKSKVKVAAPELSVEDAYDYEL